MYKRYLAGLRASHKCIYMHLIYHFYPFYSTLISFRICKKCSDIKLVVGQVFSEKIGLVKLHACNIIAEESLSKRIWVETEILKYYDHWEGERESTG